MLTLQELLRPPSRLPWTWDEIFGQYFEEVVWPRLEKETFGTDDCMVVDPLRGGLQQNIFTALVDHMARELIHRPAGRCALHWDLRWIQFILSDISFRASAGDITLPGVELEVHRKSVEILNSWLDVYVANRDPLQHFPKLDVKQLEWHVLRTIVIFMPSRPFDAEQMPHPECLVFLWRTRSMSYVLRYLKDLSRRPPWAAAFLQCLISLGRSKEPFNMEWIGSVMTQLVDRLAPPDMNCSFVDAASEALAVWVQAYELRRGDKSARILMDLVGLYRTQVLRGRGTDWQRRAAVYLSMRYGAGDLIIRWFRPTTDAALMARARMVMSEVLEEP